jgi:hypothetical protein
MTPPGQSPTLAGKETGLTIAATSIERSRPRRLRLIPNLQSALRTLREERVELSKIRRSLLSLPPGGERKSRPTDENGCDRIGG